MADEDGRGVSELLSLVDAGQRARAGAVSELLVGVDAARRARTGEVSELLVGVRSVQHARAMAVSELLGHVAPQLVAIREKERELDRKEARRFNVFKYLQTGELGLSRMIADLLDPAAEHGQGPDFLDAMLDMLSKLDVLSDTDEKTGALPSSLRATAANRAKVATERGIPSGGFIDIIVDIPSDAGLFCLAFENKPYADDGHRQLSRYLEYLDERYGRRFLLVYVPPYARDPGEWSLSPEERKYWRERGQFRVMPYSGGEVSIEGWLGTCRERCTADRLKLYLEDAQSFCRQLFGGSTMTTDSEMHFIREHLSGNRNHMHAALAIYDAWPAIRTEVCRRFLQHLHHKVEEGLRAELAHAGGLRVRSHYEGDKQYHNRLWISQESWLRSVPPTPLTDGRTMIMLVNGSKAPNNWYWGVRNPKRTGEMTEAEKERVEALETALRRAGLSLGGVTDWWPQWEYLPRYRDWYPLAPDLADECDAGGGTITDYYVDGLLRIARLAIPAIDEVEAARTTTSTGTAAAVDEAVSGQEPEVDGNENSPDPADSPDPAGSGE